MLLLARAACNMAAGGKTSMETLNCLKRGASGPRSSSSTAVRRDLRASGATGGLRTASVELLEITDRYR